MLEKVIALMQKLVLFVFIENDIYNQLHKKICVF